MTYLSTQKTPAIAPNYLEATPLKRLLAALLAGLALNACSGGSGVGLDQSGRPTTGDASSGNTPPTTGSASFESIQDSVFTPICTVCHAGGSAPLGLKLDAANAYAMLVGVSSVQVPGIARVAPGDPDNSYLIQKLEGTAASGGQMPLGGPPLSADNIELIRRWIIDGALPPGQQTPGESPPTVLSVSPQADSVLASAPQDISASFSQNMDSSLVSDLTFTLTASGGDGSFIEGNEVAVMPTGVTLVNAQTAAMDLAGLSISDDLYEARLVGSGATALAGVSGLVLDGDSDGLEGGDFAWRFTIDSGVAVAQPTWRWIQDNIFTPICTQCHISGGIAGFLILDELSSYANTVNVPSTEVASLNLIQPGSPDTSYLLQKLEGTAAVGAQMPLGLPALDTESIAAVRDWILDGALLEPGDPMPDVLAPVVTLSVPPSPLMNSVTLSATAVDDTGVALVRFYVDGELIGSDASDPYAAVWETLSVANGEHIVAAEAADLAGNIGRSADVIVEVANPLPPDVIAPTVSVTNPGSPLSGTVFVTTLAEDNEAVIAVRLFIDEQLVASFAAPPYQYSWDTAQAANGTHTLRAEADDAAGNVGASATISVTVDNGLPPDTEAPTVAINNLTSPVSGPVTVTMSASDNVGVTVVRLFADGVLIGSDSALPYSIIWDSTTVTDGPHVLTAEAQDAAGNTGASGPLVVTVENNPGPQATWRWIQDNIFDPLCVSCHVTGGIADFLWLDEASSFNQLVNAATTEGGPQFRVLPGNPDNSALVQRLEGTLTPQMPLGALPLSAAEIAAVRQWILDGALQSPPADTTAPVVSLAPTGDPVSGVISLRASASDDVAVAVVRFLVDGVLIASDFSSPYEAVWDTNTVADGVHELTVEADDAAGNTGAAAPVAITVDNTLPPDTTAPMVSIQPVESPVSGVVTVLIDATDETGVSTVTLSVDGITIGTDLEAPYALIWDTTSVSNGEHTLVATATDGAGNVGTSSPLIVNIANVGPSLELSVNSPAQVNRGDEFPFTATISNSGPDSPALLASLTLVPSTIMRIRDPGPDQSVGIVSSGETVSRTWTLRGDEAGVATVTVRITDSPGQIDIQQQVLISVAD